MVELQTILELNSVQTIPWLITFG